MAGNEKSSSPSIDTTRLRAFFLPTRLMPEARRYRHALCNGPSLPEKEVVMFTMTETAGEYLTTLLDSANAEEETAIRLVLEGNTLTPTLDSARPGDATFDHEGRMVLVLDAQVTQVLAESMLDVRATEEGPKLFLLR
jgi:hypothetical protein